MIKMLLLLMGVKQVDIARKIGVTPPYVNYVIMGKRPTKRVRIAIAEAVHRPVDELWPPPMPENNNDKKTNQINDSKGTELLQ